MAIERNIYDWFEMMQNMHSSNVKKILFEGDSWAAHPLRAGALATAIDNFKPDEYATLNIGWPGDDAADVFHPGRKQFKRLRRLLNNKQHGDVFDMIFLSLGGNDIVGPEIWKKGYVKRKTPGMGDQGSDLITREFYDVIDKIVDGYRRFMEMKNGDQNGPGQNKDTPVIAHAYSYLIPREVGTKFLGISFNKGWVSVHLKKLGIRDKDEQYVIVKEMLDAFYRAIANDAVLKADPNFLMVDTRRVLLRNGQPSRKFWKDEIHPTKKGFRMVAEHIKAAAEKKDLWRL